MTDYDEYEDDFDYDDPDEEPKQRQAEKATPYTEQELKSLWTSFAYEAGADEMLAGFAQCSKKEARDMIRSFTATAAAKRAAEADKKRMESTATTKTKKPVEAPKTGTESSLESALDPVSDADISLFPDDSTLAADLNVKYGYSLRILAEGRSGRKKMVFVEQTRDRSGHNIFRVKTVRYSYHRDLNSALCAAQAQRVNLELFGCTQ